MTMSLIALALLLTTDTGATRAVTGLVQDALGGAVGGADIFVACGPIWRHTSTDADGRFTIAGLPEARCGLRVEGDQFSPRRLAIDLTRQDERVTVVLDLGGLTTEVAVTPLRAGEELATAVPSHTTVTRAEDIRARVQQILPQGLSEEPGIVVQQTTTAQGAPLIRGLIGQQNVTVIDGVRLNTSAWRSGPSQYTAWYNANLVDRLEVMRGPGSVLYGSDAMGGTVYVRTIQPGFSTGGVTVGGTADLHVSSADSGRSADALVSVSGPRAGLLAGGGYAKFDDTRPGKGIDSHAAVTRYLGLPSTVLGRSTMPGTGYEQRFGHAAAAFGVGTLTRVDASYHYDEQIGASRYDRIEGGEGLFRSGFSPQRLDLAQVRMERGRTGFLDSISAAFSVNRQDDGRFEQARSTANLDAQVNTTTALGYQLQGLRTFSRHQLTAGGEVYDEFISGSRTITTAAGVPRSSRPDIPDGTRYTTVGFFAQDVFELVPRRLWLRGGLRYGHFGFSTQADPALGVVDESVTAQAVTWQGGAVVGLTDALQLTFSAGRAFRAPNASDLGSIGLSGGGGFEVAPSRARALGGELGSADGAAAVSTGRPIEQLRPETVHTFEAGIRLHGRRVLASLAAYDMEMNDAIQRRAIVFPSGIVGTTISGFEVVRQDASGLAYIALDARPVSTRANISKARIAGVEADLRVRLRETWVAGGWVSYSRGTDLDLDVPLRRVPPGVGGVRLRWEPMRRPLWIEGLGTFMTRYTRMAPGDLTDARMGGRRTAASIANYFNGTATDIGLVRNGVLVPTGETLGQVQQRVLGGVSSAPLFAELPGYFVTTVRAGYRFGRQLEVIVVGDNLGDVNYRHLGSGVDAAGRNLRVQTRITF